MSCIVVLCRPRTYLARVQAQGFLANILSGKLEILGMGNGELRVVIEDIEGVQGGEFNGAIVLVQGQNVVRTMKSGFGLAGVAIPSPYRWGGIIDLPSSSLPLVGKHWTISH